MRSTTAINGLNADTKDELPLDRLDWAIAGTSSSRMLDDGKGGQVQRSKWTHWINSQAADAESQADEGDMYPQPDGTTLEVGSMVNPETGIDTAYEEVWDDADPQKTVGSHTCVVLQHEEGKTRGLVVRLGRYSQGYFKKGDDNSLERWEWTAEGGARRTVRIGQQPIPCAETMGDATFNVGDEVKAGDAVWKVIEVA